MSQDVKPGKILPDGSLFIAFRKGSASGGEGHAYELLTSSGGNPIVRSDQTGQSFHLSWQELIDMAIQAGIDRQMDCVLKIDQSDDS